MVTNNKLDIKQNKYISIEHVHINILKKQELSMHFCKARKWKYEAMRALLFFFFPANNWFPHKAKKPKGYTLQPVYFQEWEATSKIFKSKFSDDM